MRLTSQLKIRPLPSIDNDGTSELKKLTKYQGSIKYTHCTPQIQLHPRHVVRIDTLSRIPPPMKRFRHRLVRNTEKQTQSEDRTKRDPAEPREGDKCREHATGFEMLTPG